jgi:hypothetical protein
MIRTNKELQVRMRLRGYKYKEYNQVRKLAKLFKATKIVIKN